MEGFKENAERDDMIIFKTAIYYNLFEEERRIKKDGVREETL